MIVMFKLVDQKPLPTARLNAGLLRLCDTSLSVNVTEVSWEGGGQSC